MDTEKNKPKTTADNTAVITIAAFQNRQEKTLIFRKTAQRCGINVRLFQTEEPWVNFVENKTIKLLRDIESLPENIKYILYADGRDVIFLKPAAEFYAALDTLPKDKITFNNDHTYGNKLGATYPLRASWFASRIFLKYDNVCNSGIFFGERTLLSGFMRDSLKLRQRLIDRQAEPNSTEELVQKAIYGETAFYECSACNYANTADVINDDQFIHQLMQFLWDERIYVDNELRVFGFAKGVPKMKDGKLTGRGITETAVLTHTTHAFNANPFSHFYGTLEEYIDWAERLEII